MTECLRSFTQDWYIQRNRYRVKVISTGRIMYSLYIKDESLFDGMVLIVSRQLPAIVLKIHNL